MQVIYAQEAFPPVVSRSIFLAGPTPRSADVKTWREEALALLAATDFAKDGTVFVPELWDGKWQPGPDAYLSQVTWEEDALNRADCILFWVPRDMGTLPGLTTNVEFGFWADSGKVVFGAPTSAHSVRYLKHYADKLQIPSAEDLGTTLAEAIKKVPVPAPRMGGECCVPFHIWQSESFQAWYRELKRVGNRLDGARVVWTFSTKKVLPVRPVFWALHADVHITSEGRNKTNEVVLSRMDLSSVVLFLRKDPIWDSEVALVREFRTPVRNSAGYVYEPPGGSSFNPDLNPYDVAVSEVQEETGLTVDRGRVTALESRQLMATMSAHKSHLFTVSLTPEEMVWLKSREGVVCGNEADTERTYVEILTLREIIDTNVVDWSMMGMIFRAVFGQDG